MNLNTIKYANDLVKNIEMHERINVNLKEEIELVQGEIYKGSVKGTFEGESNVHVPGRSFGNKKYSFKIDIDSKDVLRILKQKVFENESKLFVYKKKLELL